MLRQFIHRLGTIFGKGSTSADSSFGVVVGVSVLLTGVASVVVLLLQFVPIVLYMVEGIALPKLLGLLPVLAIFTFVFGFMAFILFMGLSVGMLLMQGLVIGGFLGKLQLPRSPSDSLWNAVWGSFTGYLFFLLPMFTALAVKYLHWPVSVLLGSIIFATFAASFFSLRSLSIVTGKNSWLGIPALVQILPVAIVLWKFFPKITPWIT